MNLFYVLKLNTSTIIKYNYYIDTDFKSARDNGEIISLGDNQLLQFIRRIKQKEFDERYIADLFDCRNELKGLDESEENSKQILGIQNKINEYLFVPDLISIKTDSSKKDYKNICKNHFIVKINVNNTIYEMKYKRLCAGAGQLRRNSALFVNEDIYDDLENIMMCGLDRSRIGKINLAKFSAYFALYTSASKQVKTPNICVIKDFEYMLKHQDVLWVKDAQNNEKDIEHKYIDFEINAFDGSGMISPEMAMIWQENLDLDYLPASYIIRSAWVKGLVSIFDFKKFAREIANTDVIIDAWGKKHNIDDIDMILTTSQFKMYKKYQSWDEYIYYHKKYEHIFSVARVTKKENNFVTPLNYQYIQTNNFTEDTIKGLSEFTVDWLQKIMTGDKLYTSLFLMGCQDEDAEQLDLENSMNSDIAKCLMYNEDILNDIYVRKKISQMLEKKVNQAKIGKLLIEGSYDFSIPDLYAMAEWAFGMEVKGLLKYKECWNKRWVDKGSNVVTLMRSPLVDPSENQKLNICFDEKCNEWFKYIYSGNILNIWDMTAIAASDADYDGDLFCVSDNKYLVEAVDGNLPTITYEKQKAKEQSLNFENFANMDVKSFNSKIGGITNLASNMFAMLSNFKEDSDEYKELKRRIALLRYYQGSAIDSTKGQVFTPPPTYWSKRMRYKQVSDSMDDTEKSQIVAYNDFVHFNNKICCDRKAYFFGYIYPKYMDEYKKYKREMSLLCKIRFSMSLEDAKDLVDKSPELKGFLRSYYNYMPLFNSKCIMNVLTRHIEDMEFNNTWSKQIKSFDYRCLLSDKNFIPDKDIIKKLKPIINEFNKYNKMFINDKNYSQDVLENLETESMGMKFLFQSFEEKLFSVCSNQKILTDHLIYLYYEVFITFSKTMMWNVVGNQIVLNVRNRATKMAFPIKDENGEEYLGQKYKLIEVEL